MCMGIEARPRFKAVTKGLVVIEMFLSNLEGRNEGRGI